MRWTRSPTPAGAFSAGRWPPACSADPDLRRNVAESYGG